MVQDMAMWFNIPLCIGGPKLTPQTTDSKIHILGGFKNIHVARESVVSLILGAPPGKVYHNLRTVSARMKERF
jgi:hypothetical protein